MSVIKNLSTILWQNQTIRQTVFKNTFWLSFGQIISRLIKFILIVYAARLLGSSAYGSFAYVLSFVSLVFMFSDLGVSALMIREYNKPGIDKYKLFINSLYIKIFLSLASSILALSLIFFINDPVAKSVLLFIILVNVVDGVRDIFLGVARAEEKMEMESVTTITSAIITTILGIWFLFTFTSVVTLGLAYLLGSISSFILILLLVTRFLPKILIKPDLNYIKKILSVAWPFAFGFIIAAILTSTDTVMLGLIKDPETVGHYSVGVRIIQVLLTIPAFLSVALLPSLSKFAEEKKRIIKFIKKAISYVLMIGFPMFLGGLVIAPKLIPKLFGPEYYPGVISFQILLLLIIIVFPVVIFDYLLLAFNMQIKNFQYTAIAAIANIFLNLLLIPIYGLYGAAIATVSAQLINLILTNNLVTTTLKQPIWQISSMIKFLIASIVMAVLILWLISIGLSLWIIFVLAILIYFGSLYIIREKNILEILKIING